MHIEASVDLYVQECKEQQKAIEHDEEDNRTQLITSHLLLVVYLAGKYYRNSSLSFSDLIQVGNLGLLKSLDSYDQSRSDHFRAHAEFCIRRELWNFIQCHRRRHENLLSLDYLMREDEEKKITLAEKIASHDTFEEVVITQQTLRKFLAYLPPQEKQVLCLHYGLNREHREYTYQELERIFHMKQRTLKTIIDRSMRRLRVIASRVAP